MGDEWIKKTQKMLAKSVIPSPQKPKETPKSLTTQAIEVGKKILEAGKTENVIRAGRTMLGIGEADVQEPSTTAVPDSAAMLGLGDNLVDWRAEQARRMMEENNGRSNTY